MINKKIQLCMLAILALSMNVYAAPQNQQSTQNSSATAKTNGSNQNGMTYKDEVEDMRFDEYTDTDVFAVPFDQDALDDKQDDEYLQKK
jgi:hypothetical protein